MRGDNQMHSQTKSLSDFSDSRILYERKLPAFGYMIVLIISALLIGILMWSIITPKIYMVKGSGVVESENKNYIMSSYSGEISEIYIRNGDYVEKDDLLFTVKSTDLNLQQIQIEGKIEIYENQIEKLKKLQKSIEENTNYFNAENLDDSSYYNQYEAYKAQIAQSVVDVDAYKEYGYNDAQIEVEIKKNEGKISEIYHSTLRSIGESITNVTAELESIRTQEDAVTKGKSEYNITASTSGVVHMSADYKEGMVIQAGSSIGSIANDDAYVIKSYININDMPRVNTGDDVDIAVAGLMESIYGTISGKLVRIDSDITSQQSNSGNGQDNFENGGVYFRLDIEPDTGYLVSNSGRKYGLSNGTAVETRIKYDEVSYFEYFLESLGILVR